MERQQLPPRPDEHRAFPRNLDAFRARLTAGDEQAREAYVIGTGWLRAAHSGIFRSSEDPEFLRAN
jgi:hypothetical protein